ncbi:UDP-N-acetylmuramoylalanine--D-glutamate ligase [Helicobacter sp. 13S00401-1]|uniref:UDP-N-acetylmuramoyl-L-alanine--D-glutamate ligase n=1 Tax=Helicobacter sp. 13S00401-1 TaxID=1905758 RepID=UPI000BA66927|nr:UDP-N-acetylmuramoyl-L-alanine--D-glutamate ligase [Helicobacter sp. 13S00401-1]PAF49018.1 UDP-N-acetylmuramoylalanine--D-glutamate ligase [Helicobacter sp. 13S00401-1]
MINLIGYGLTNKALAKLLDSKNIAYRIFDDTLKDSTLKDFNALNLSPSDINIITPGIPPFKVTHAVISDYEYLYANYKFPFDIWISGTNGKTTTTQMCAFLNEHALACGNIGLPLSEALAKKASLLAIETSSFTLHYTKDALPKIYLLLPIEQDHISWHGSFTNYIDDKLRPLSIFLEKIAKGEDAKSLEFRCIVPKALKDNLIVKTFMSNHKDRIFLYEDEDSLKSHFHLEEAINFSYPFSLDATLALSAYKLAKLPITRDINDFKIGAHKMEEYVFNGVTFIDDSKATNPHATYAALTSYLKNLKDTLHLILGGDLKGADIGLIIPLLNNPRIKIYTLGRDGLKISEILKKQGIDSIYKETLKEVMAFIESKKGDLVLLSPACASLDQYPSYALRGEEFINLARSKTSN